ncbi:SPOR domain-containing protein [Paenibacillus sp. CN-4]|uniref:SPOR domain-containing protein n=1 Tax=Paenibacillus nanchangensis TaxID=3348343 RepID=UPI0039783729
MSNGRMTFRFDTERVDGERGLREVVPGNEYEEDRLRGKGSEVYDMELITPAGKKRTESGNGRTLNRERAPQSSSGPEEVKTTSNTVSQPSQHPVPDTDPAQKETEVWIVPDLEARHSSSGRKPDQERFGPPSADESPRRRSRWTGTQEKEWESTGEAPRLIWDGEPAAYRIPPQADAAGYQETPQIWDREDEWEARLDPGLKNFQEAELERELETRFQPVWKQSEPPGRKRAASGRNEERYPPSSGYGRQPDSPYPDREDPDAEWNTLLQGDLYFPRPERQTTRASGGSGGYYSKRPSSWWKFAISAAGALGTGLLLGYAALSFFGGMSGSDAPPADSAVRGGPAIREQAAGGAPDGGAVSGDAAADGLAGEDGPAGLGTSGLPIGSPGAAGGVAVRIEPQRYYLLQYGVFSSPEGAAKAQQELLAAGLAAGFDPADGSRVYAGVSPDREQAKLLSNRLQTRGIELYVRELALPSPAQAAFSGDAETVNRFFEVSGRLAAGLGSLSASLLGGGAGASGADPALLPDLHLEWTEALKNLQTGLSPETRQVCAELENAVTRAISAWEEYGKNKADGLLWEMQAATMSFCMGQKELVRQMSL